MPRSTSGRTRCRMLIAQPKGTQFHGHRQLLQVGPAWPGAGGLGAAVARLDGADRPGAAGLPAQAGPSTTSRGCALSRPRPAAAPATAAHFIAPGPRETGLRARDHPARGRGPAGRHLLRAAGQPRGPSSCWSSISAAARPSSSGSTSSGVAPKRAAARDHAPARRLPAGRAARRGARVVDWISVPLGVATLRDQFDDVEDDGARFALMCWFFEENLADFAPLRRPSSRARGSRSSAPRARSPRSRPLPRPAALRPHQGGRAADDLGPDRPRHPRPTSRSAPRGAATDPRIGARPPCADHVGRGDPAGADAGLADRPAVGGGSRPARGAALRADERGWGAGARRT